VAHDDKDMPWPWKAFVTFIVLVAFALVAALLCQVGSVGVVDDITMPRLDQLMYVTLFDQCIELTHLPSADQIDSCRDYAITGATQ